MQAVDIRKQYIVRLRMAQPDGAHFRATPEAMAWRILSFAHGCNRIRWCRKAGKAFPNGGPPKL